MAEDKLARYIVGDLLKWFKDERQRMFEPQWRRNYDAFRGKYDSDSLRKWKGTEGNDWRSKVFVRLTKQKVMTGFNHVRKFVTPGGKLAWDMSPTPIPEERPGIYMPEDIAMERCAAMKRQISDNFSETKIERAFLSGLLEMSIYGINCLMSPVIREHPEVKAVLDVPGLGGLDYDQNLVSQFGRYRMEMKQIMRPTTINPGVWNTFWDLENPDPQRGHGVCIRDMMSKGRFLELMDKPGYDKEAIMEIAKQFTSDDEAGGVEDDSHGPSREEFNARKRVIEVYFFYGRVPKKYLKEEDTPGVDEKNARELEIFCVVAKGKRERVIRKPVLNPLFMRPTHFGKWEDIPMEAGGVGIPEDMEDSQMVINGLTRSILDNKALASNLLLFWNPRMMAPGQNKALYPGKSFEVQEGVDDARKAMGFYSPPDNTGNTPNLIEMFREFADTETGIARTMEGTQAPGDQTAFEISKLTQAGNVMISGTLQNIDEGQIEPIVAGHYHYHMLTNPNDNIKGDYLVEAKGFQSFQEKAERGQDLMAMFQFALSNEATRRYPKIGENLKELARVRDLDYEKFFNSDKDVQQQLTDELAATLPQGAGAGGEMVDQLPGGMI